MSVADRSEIEDNQFPIYIIAPILMKTIILLLLVINFSASAQSNIVISDIENLKDAINSASPGDTITVIKGSYDYEGSITITNKGSVENPIIIKAEEILGVELTGETYFDFRQCEFMILEGFNFTSKDVTAVKLQACNNIRLTKNRFALEETESLKWVLVGGIWNDPNALSHHNRIDHNLFENKFMPGNFLILDGTPEPTYLSSQYDRIDHNHFKINSPRVENEKESIRVGWSELSESSGFTVVEHNLFEDCDGDPEIISVKTCDDTIRYNTFIRCAGTLSLRHGNRSSVYSNFFLGEGKSGTGGIRLYGDDHLIYNNYFEGLTGTTWDAPITLTNGDYDGGANLSKHFRINRAIVVHNTLINNSHNIEIGFTNNGKYGKPPREVVIADNIVVADTNEIVKLYSEPITFTWENNLFWTEDNAIIGADLDSNAYWSSDPLLEENIFYKQSANSPTIDQASNRYDFITNDIEGQQRSGMFDVGADEFSSDPIIFKPLTESEVGPFADMNITKIINKSVNTPIKYLLYQNYPNPFNPTTTITFMLDKQADVKLEIYNSLGGKVATLINANKSAGQHHVTWDATEVTSGIYFYRINANSKILTKKMLLLR